MIDKSIIDEAIYRKAIKILDNEGKVLSHKTKHRLYLLKYKIKINLYLKELNHYMIARDKVYYHLEDYKNIITHYTNYQYSKNEDYGLYGIQLLNEVKFKENYEIPKKVKDEMMVLLNTLINCTNMINECRNELKKLSVKAKLKTSEFNFITNTFFELAATEIIEKGARFSFGKRAGTIKIIPSRKSRTSVDFNATRLKKKEIIAKSLKPYNKEEHEKAILAGEEYNGVKYLVYRDNQRCAFLNWNMSTCSLEHKEGYTFTPAKGSPSSGKKSFNSRMHNFYNQLENPEEFYK